MALFKGSFAEFVHLRDKVAAARPGSRAAATYAVRRRWFDSWTVDFAGWSFTAIVMAWAVLSSGCGAREHVTEETTRIVIHATQPPVVTPIDAAPAIAKPFPAEVRSVRFVQTTTLRKEPRGDAPKLGAIAKDARAAVVSAATGDGCKTRWIEIAPRGWACETAIEPSTEEPSTATAFAFDAPDDDKPLVPGVYGVVRGADVSTSVRAAGTAVVDGVRHWRTTSGALIPEASIVQFAPSKFRGVILAKGDAMPAWVLGRDDPRKPVRTFATPNGRPNGELARRTVVQVLEDSDDGKFVRVSDTAWVRRRDVRVASRVEPPAGTAATEKWFDIDRDEQVLVAYEGERPVYATLVSTGKWKHATPTVITRVASKLQTANMNNNRGDEQYAVADVPWTMFYDGHYALHTSYWHDGFGGPRSHGCINLAPRDARLLYQWSSPDVPPGWVAVYGDVDHPGSLVRVRSKDTPDPEFRGYARTLRDQAMLAAN